MYPKWAKTLISPFHKINILYFNSSKDFIRQTTFAYIFFKNNVFLSFHGKFKTILEFCKKLWSMKLKMLVGKSDSVWVHIV